MRRLAKNIRNSYLPGLALGLACLCIMLLPVGIASAHTRAGGNGRIYGQLLDGTQKNAPLPGQTVTLQVAQTGTGQDLATAKTDAQGRYSFTNLSTDKTLNYVVYMNYQGAQYLSNIVTLDTQPVQQLNLLVYDATSNSAKVAVVDATILMQEPDPTHGIITVSEFFDFKNLDRFTYVGSLDASKGRPNALLFSLPVGARHIVLGQGFSGYNVIQVDHGFASNAALLPGDTQFSFSFDVPYNSTSYSFTYTAFYPTVSIALLTPPDVQTNSALLTSQGVITANQHPYRLFKTSGLLVQQGFSASLNGLHAPVVATPPTPLNTTLIWLVVLLLLMGAVLVVTWFLYTARRRQARNAVPRATPSGKRAGAVKESKKTLSEQQEVLLQELLQLDKNYEAGKITKAVYQERRAKTKARLRSLMSERETARR